MWVWGSEVTCDGKAKCPSQTHFYCSLFLGILLEAGAHLLQERGREPWESLRGGKAEWCLFSRLGGVTVDLRSFLNCCISRVEQISGRVPEYNPLSVCCFDSCSRPFIHVTDHTLLSGAF